MNANDAKQSSQMGTKKVIKFIVDYTVRTKRVVYVVNEEQAKSFVGRIDGAEKVIIHGVEPINEL